MDLDHLSRLGDYDGRGGNGLQDVEYPGQGLQARDSRVFNVQSVQCPGRTHLQVFELGVESICIVL